MKPKQRLQPITQDTMVAVRVDHRLRDSFAVACEKNNQTKADVLRTMMTLYVHKSLGNL